MCGDTLNKRGVKPVGQPRRVRTVESDGWQIAFSHRAGYATLMKKEDDCEGSSLKFANPHGVLYVLEVDDLSKIESREVGYRKERMRVLTYDDGTQDGNDYKEGEIVEGVIVFVSVPWLRLRRAVAPAERYIGLLRSGALENGLDREYVAWLEAVPSVDASKMSRNYYSYNDTLSEAAAKAVALVMLALVGVAAAS